MYPLIKNIFHRLNKAFVDCRPKIPLTVNLYAPDLCVRSGKSNHVQIIFVLGCIFGAPVPWNLRREKICDCEMIEVQIGTSLYEMRHTCKHRSYVELYPLSGIVSVIYNLYLIYLTVVQQLTSVG